MRCIHWSVADGSSVEGSAGRPRPPPTHRPGSVAAAAHRAGVLPVSKLGPRVVGRLLSVLAPQHRPRGRVAVRVGRPRGGRDSATRGFVFREFATPLRCKKKGVTGTMYLFAFLHFCDNSVPPPPLEDWSLEDWAAGSSADAFAWLRLSPCPGQGGPARGVVGLAGGVLERPSPPPPSAGLPARRRRWPCRACWACAAVWRCPRESPPLRAAEGKKSHQHLKVFPGGPPP